MKTAWNWKNDDIHKKMSAQCLTTMDPEQRLIGCPSSQLNESGLNLKNHCSDFEESLFSMHSRNNAHTQ